MNLTLADLIAAALRARELKLRFDDSFAEERQQLALNALTERLEEIIDERITQMLKELR